MQMGEVCVMWTRLWKVAIPVALLLVVTVSAHAATPACPCTIWPSTAVPALIDQGPDSSVELGVSFRADSNGYITAIRFYKNAANTGTHVGNLWSSTGALLATAIFTGESASGWQQVSFGSPVAITANTTYVASYHANAGHYSANTNYFTTSGTDSVPLHAPANGSGSLNGRYAYGTSSVFPASTYQSTNYWVDVVFDTTVSTAPIAPAITSQPTSQTVIAGQTASFSVTATGTAPLAYQWRKNGVNISGAISPSYTTPVTTTANSGAQFSVVVSNFAGSATSGSATLAVNVAAVAPAVTTQPTSQTVIAGQAATFSVAATGTAPLSYQWRKNGVNISGATASWYATPVTTTADSGAQFSAVVGNSAGSATSSSAALTVNAAAVAPVITTQPSGQAVMAGQTAAFSVTATGTASLSYQWRKNGVNISGATSPSYTTPVTTTADSGAQFSVVVSNSAGSVTSNSAALTVNATNVAPVITTQPAGQTVTAGQTATFWVGATGTTPLSYQWRKSGVNIGGATASSYTTPVTTTADSGAQFSVVVSNSAGSVTSNSAALAVNASLGCPCTIWPTTAVPSFTDGGPDAPAELGVTFRADSDGNITGIRFYKSAANTGTHVGNLWSSAGTLLATATFSGESASGWQQVNFSSPVAITANTTYVASYHANSGHYSADQNYFATSGADRAPLHAPANGSGAMNGRYAYGSSSAFPSSSYLATSYWVDVVFNPAAISSPVAPVITSQPASQTVIAGQTATFSVTVTGTAPLSFQWKRSGTNISGANSSSYTTPATTAADSGAQFSVVVSNSAGSATSTNATLTVNAATRLLSATPTSLSFGNISIGGSSLLTSTLKNTGNSSVTVSSVNIVGAGLNVNGVSTGQTLLPGQTATLNVTLAPASIGVVAGSVTVASNASNSPTTVLVAAAGIKSLSHSTTLSWTGSKSTVAGYHVYSGLTSGGPYTRLTSVPVAGLSYLDSTVQSGQTYRYVVTAVDSTGGESVLSNEATAVVP
jgi:hypothetical protein